MFGDYRIIALAGQGGMGVVYKAVHVRLRRLVALKLIRADLTSDPGFEDRFLREAALAASIKRHENVVIVYDSGVEDNRLFIAMEWVDGNDLKSILDREGRLAPDRAVAIVLQTANALEAVHDTMVHRDVKPANIMVSDSGEAPHVYLTDFGIARPNLRGDTLTHSGAALGTRGYLSPEQAASRSVDLRTDLYALGCVFFEAMTGKPVVPADADETPGWEHAQGTLLSLVPLLGRPYESFDPFLGMALAIDPDGRQSSASEFARALEAAARGCPATSDFPQASGRPDPPRQPQTELSPIAREKSDDDQDGEEATDVTAAGGASNTKRARKPVAWSALASVVVIAAAAGILAANGAFSPGPRPPRPERGWQKPRSLDTGPLGSTPSAGVDASNDVVVFWAGTNHALREQWRIDGTWSQPASIAAAGDGVALQPAVAVHLGGEQNVFWNGSGHKLYEIAYTRDWSKAAPLPTPHTLGTAIPTTGVDENGSVYVFWKGANGALWVKWNVNGVWNGPRSLKKARHGLLSQPAVAVHSNFAQNGEQDVFWEGKNGDLYEMSHTSTGWHPAVDLKGGPLGSPPTAGVDGSGNVYVYWEGTDGTLWEKRQVDGKWKAPQWITAAGHGVSSQPAVAVQPNGEQVVFWESANKGLWEITDTRSNTK